MERQNWRCCYCGVRMWAGHDIECPSDFARSHGYYVRPGGASHWVRARKAVRRYMATFEHVVPLKFGGPNDERNIVGACAQCNNERGHRIDPIHWEAVCALDEIEDDTRTMQWQTIETAPSGHANPALRVLVWNKRLRLVECKLADGEWWRRVIAEGHGSYTHWMPIPAPPTDME